MTFKPGDLVTMNTHGYAYHGNLDRAFENYSIGCEVNKKYFQQSMCEILALQGVGAVLEVNEKDRSLRIKWTYSLKGMFYYYTMWYDFDDVDKLSFLQKLKYHIFGRV